METQYTPEQKKRAYRMMYAAIRTGELIPAETCEDCGQSFPYRLAGHHHRGYADEFALDVVWLCRRCHGRAETIGRGWATPEGSAAGGRNLWASMTPEERSAEARRRAIKQWASKTPDEISEARRKAALAKHAAMTPEQRSNIAKRGNAALTPEQRSARTARGWETRRARMAATRVPSRSAQAPDSQPPEAGSRST